MRRKCISVVIAAFAALLFVHAPAMAQKQLNPPAPSLIGNWNGTTSQSNPRTLGYLSGTYANLLVVNQWPNGVFGGSMYTHSAKGTIDARITFDPSFSRTSTWHVQISFGSNGMTWRLEGEYLMYHYFGSGKVPPGYNVPIIVGTYQAIDNKTHAVVERGQFSLDKK